MSWEGELDLAAMMTSQENGQVAAFDAEFEEHDYRSLGIDPEEPTTAKPGSEHKVLMLAARYAAGLPLWHNSDCYEHGPSESAVAGAGLQLEEKPPELEFDLEEEEEE